MCAKIDVFVQLFRLNLKFLKVLFKKCSDLTENETETHTSTEAILKAFPLPKEYNSE